MHKRHLLMPLEHGHAPPPPPPPPPPPLAHDSFLCSSITSSSFFLSTQTSQHPAVTLNPGLV
ncbi:hypothetical protein EYF80_053942 [Liparis tanakae]|uniref:Uncharacterized protein n=1 Tax=Liparis tanakae TaxID=230148 RepID=A0A4Z2F405_9TELE|nr:hypothetical protein EYF80_053942 [Liparis tanakae]